MSTQAERTEATRGRLISTARRLFAERGFAAAPDWLRATAQAITSCGCTAGCPSCIQSPKCGSGNHPLDKQGAAQLLACLLRGAAS